METLTTISFAIFFLGTLAYIFSGNEKFKSDGENKIKRLHYRNIVNYIHSHWGKFN